MKLLPLAVSVCALTACLAAGLDPAQRGRMQRAVHAMLGFEADAGVTSQGATPLGATPGVGATQDTAPMKPSYMLKLYERFKQSRASVPDGNGTVNTVRSIHAQNESVRRKRLLVFDLRSILASEEVLKAEMHIYKRKRKRRLDVTADLYELRRRTLRSLASWPDVLSQRLPGWQTYDVTSTLKGCLSQRRRSLSLALGFSVRQPGGALMPLSRKQFARHMLRPFLVVFSNDVQNISLDQLESHFSDDDLRQSFIDPQSGLSRRFSDGLLPPQTAGPPSPLRDTILSTRSRRSVHDNEIPKDGLAPPPRRPDAYNRPRTHPAILQGRTEFRERLPPPPPPRVRIIPYPDDVVRRRRRRKHRKYRRQRNRNQRPATFPPAWDASGDEREATAAADGDRLCQRRRLTVDFADIGMREWIISPKSFEAHYCAGSCSFPMNRKLRPSNHATIQSLVKAVGLDTRVPAPCCVPDTLSSVTLLYFDPSHNVVLKNYPDMSVQSCACR